MKKGASSRPGSVVAVSDVIRAVENMYEYVNHNNGGGVTDAAVTADVTNNNDEAPEPPPTRRHKSDELGPPPTQQLRTSRPSAMDLTTVGGRRSLWTELPEVVNSGVLSTISTDRKRLQEAMFEVVSSEASYLKSLNILIRHFVQSPKLMSYSTGECHNNNGVITKRDARVLFSDIISVSQNPSSE